MSGYRGKNVIIKDNCIIGENVIIEDDVYIDHFCIINDNVKIGKGSTIGSNCVIGEHQMDFYEKRQVNGKHSLSIGQNAIIRSGTIIYDDTIIGDHFETGHHVTIREQTLIGDHVRIGTLTDIQGYCKIGNYTRMHSNVFIGQKAVIEDFVWIFPHVILTNDPTPPSNEVRGVTIKEFAAVAAGSIILPGVTVESDTLIAAGAVVTKDVIKNTVVGGNPAKVIGDIRKVKNHITGELVYPWRDTFKRGMPWETSDYDTWVIEGKKQI